KVFGRPRYIHDLELPGMLHGRVIRPRTPGAKLLEVDDTAARAVPGFLRLVRDGSFLGVLAASEAAAMEAARRIGLRARWGQGFELPDEGALADWHRGAPVEASEVLASGEGAPSAATVVSASYGRPFLAHGSIAPCCALAQWSGD